MIHIRQAASQADFAAAHRLIKELAAFEEAAEEVTLSLEQFIVDGSGENPLYQLTLAEFCKENGDKEIVGMCLYYTIYSTWKGKILYLDDLVVTEAFRRKGVGKLLVAHLFDYARTIEANQVRWHVLDWNEPAIQFYRKLNMKLEDDWITCKLSKAQLMG